MTDAHRAGTAPDTDKGRPMAFEDAARPSRAASDRLARSVGAEVTTLRSSLATAMDEAERLEASGRADLAVEVLEAQRDVLLRVHRQLEDHLSAAAVEREAEAVLAGVALAAEASTVTAVPAPRPLVPSAAVGAAGRLLASAVAAVLGVGLLGLGQLDRSGGVTIAGVAVDDAPGGPAADAPTPRVPRSEAQRLVGATSEHTTSTSHGAQVDGGSGQTGDVAAVQGAEPAAVDVGPGEDLDVDELVATERTAVGDGAASVSASVAEPSQAVDDAPAGDAVAGDVHDDGSDTDTDTDTEPDADTAPDPAADTDGDAASPAGDTADEPAGADGGAGGEVGSSPEPGLEDVLVGDPAADLGGRPSVR